MLDRARKDTNAIEALVNQIQQRARNLYTSRQFMCAEAVLLTINEGLGGEMSEAQAVALAAPFSAAMGESGCTCGALSGAVLACGLFLGQHAPYRRRREMRQCARQLHDQFKLTHGATCCRVICRKCKSDAKAQFQHCADLTAITAAQTARLILQKRPELLLSTENCHLLRHESRIGGQLTRLRRFLFPPKDKPAC